MKKTFFKFIMLFVTIISLSVLDNCSSNNIINANDTIINSNSLGLIFNYEENWHIGKLNDSNFIIYLDTITSTSPNMSISKKPQGSTTIDNIKDNYIDNPNLNDSIKIDSANAVSVIRTIQNIKRKEVYTTHNNNLYKIMYSADSSVFNDYIINFDNFISTIKFK